MSLLLVSGILAGTLAGAVPANADEMIDPDETCSITYQLETGANSEPVTAEGGNLEIYQIADIQSGDEGYYYHVLPDFEGAGIDFAQYKGEEGQKAFEENNIDWAGELAAYVTDNSIQPTRTENFDKGSLQIDGLSTGLYLMVQTQEVEGYEKLSPFLLTLPLLSADGEYQYNVDKAALKMVLKTAAKPDNPGSNKKNSSTTTSSSTHTGGKLPQTGQLWWPVPILIAAGVLLIVIGAVRKKRSAN